MNVNVIRVLIIWMYILGIVVYDWFQVAWGFSFFDELFVFLLLAMVAVLPCRGKESKKNMRRLKHVFAVFLFYIVYSVCIKSNTCGAIMGDWLIQTKPFFVFYCTCILGMSLDSTGKRTVHRIILFLTPFLLVIGIQYFLHEVYGYSRHSFVRGIFGHPAKYATTCQITGMLYFYCSKRTRRNVFIMFFYFALGMFSLRSKCYGFFACAFMLFFLLKGHLRFNMKNMAFLIATVCLVIYVSWNKFNFYFVGEADTNEKARAVLYIEGTRILGDYFPFGSGLASFGTYYSARPYSHIYIDYGLENIYGLSESAPKFVADTGYPVLAQFGVVGIVLFAMFFLYLWKEIARLYDGDGSFDLYSYKACVSVIAFLLIDNVADETFNHNTGMFMLMLLGMFFNERHRLNDYKGNEDHHSGSLLRPV